jgi:hypothetical protein
MTPRGSRREAGLGRCRGCGLRRPAATRSRDRSSQHGPVLVARWPADRVVCQVPVFAKSASASENSLIGSGQLLTERREQQLQLPGPVRPPHRCDHTAPASRGWTSTSTSTAAGWCAQTTPERPQRGYQSSPRQPRLDRALASASGADQPRAHGSTPPPPRLSPPPLSCHLAPSCETAPPGDSGHEIRASPRSARIRYAAGTRQHTYLREHECGLASRTGCVPQFARCGAGCFQRAVASGRLGSRSAGRVRERSFPRHSAAVAPAPVVAEALV